MNIKQIAVMCRREAKICQQCADLASEDQPEEYTASEEVEGMLWTAAAEYLESLGPRMERMSEAVKARLDFNGTSYEDCECDACMSACAALAEPTPDELAEWQEIREKATEYDRLISEYSDPEGPFSLESVILQAQRVAAELITIEEAGL